jgi:hypothetical protein
MDWFDSEPFFDTLRDLLPGIPSWHSQPKQDLWQQKKLRNTSITSAIKPTATAK